MFLERAEKVRFCFADSSKIRMMVHLKNPPNLKELAEIIGARYSEILGVVMMSFGMREVNFFASGKVTVRMVNDIEEGKKLISSILAMAAQKQLLKE